MAKIQSEVTTNQTVEVPQSQLTQLLTEMAELKKQLNEGKENKFEKAKEHYEGPLQARYKLWGDKPVASWKLKKKNPAYGLLYKDIKGDEIDNHYLDLSFADGSKDEEVLAYSFGMEHGYSDLLNFGVVLRDGTKINEITPKKLKSFMDEIESAVFNVDGQELIIGYKFIN